MSKLRLLIVFLIMLFSGISAQDTSGIKSFILVGDTHFDLWSDHDSAWLAQKPDDYRQVTQEYTVNTKNNFAPFIDELLTQSRKTELNVKGIIQTGDLQEGLAGREDLALQMARHATEALKAPDFIPPWILAKGNHDITGPGAPEAFNQIVLPFVQNEINKPVSNTYYSYTIGDVKIICIDCYDKTTLIPYLKQELTQSNAKFKIIATHQPVIPVTGRLWHIYESQSDSVQRAELLNLIAQNNALVVCGHLHKYSVVRRMTNYGPVVQIMVSSVIRDASRHTPSSYTTEYGPNLVDLEPSFDPFSQSTRRKYLTDESKYITNFRMAEMPGYAILMLNSKTGQMTLKAYSGIGQSLYEEVLLAVYSLKTFKVGKGEIKTTPADSLFLASTKVELKAEGDLGWKFTDWSGDLNSTANPDTILMDGNKTVTANFTEIPRGIYELRIKTEGSGKVVVDLPGSYYSSGTILFLKAVPEAGYKFNGWSGDMTGTDANTALTMNSHKMITAAFSKINTYKLNLGYQTNGLLTTEPVNTDYFENTSVKLTAKGNTGWEFEEWTGDKNGAVNPDTVIMTSNKEVKALFRKTQTSVTRLKAIEDSYVRGGLMYSDKNFDQDTTLRVLEGSSDMYRCRSYLKFNLKGIKPEEIVSAVLKLKVRQSGLPDGIESRAYLYSVIQDSWKEGTITWKNAPQPDILLDSCTVISKENNIYSFDITEKARQELKTNDTLISIMLKDKSLQAKTVEFYSKECSNNSLELEVQTDSKTKVEENDLTQIPNDFKLEQNYPNPFNPVTKIKYSIPVNKFVSLKIYNMLGSEVATLVNESKPAGVYTVEFDGSKISSGAYIYRLTAESFSDTKRFVLLK